MPKDALNSAEWIMVMLELLTTTAASSAAGAAAAGAAAGMAISWMFNRDYDRKCI
jgi:hypothetical protein